MVSHRIVGSEVGRSATPGNGSIRLMARGRRRRRSIWAFVFAPLILVGGVVAAIAMWPFR